MDLSRLAMALLLLLAVSLFSISAEESTASTPVDGKAVFLANCASCHGTDGNAGPAPDLVTGSLQIRYSSDQLTNYLKKNMPKGNPGSLSDEEYRAIASFLLDLNVAEANKPQTPPPEKTDDITVLVDGKKLSFPEPPRNIKGTVLVPLREIFEALGAKVSWDGKTKTVKATKQSITVTLTIGKSVATVNKKSVKLSQPAQLINGKTFVPLRFVSESLGAKVEWDGSTQTVTVTSR